MERGTVDIQTVGVVVHALLNPRCLATDDTDFQLNIRVIREIRGS